MKHNVITKLAMIVVGSLLLASFSPSLDGRAVVVDEGVMPSGLFAKTVGYLPGDIISVSNVAQNKNVDLLVIGALDASEGVAIMLTPEAAEACGIEKNSNSIVKITKRNGQDDRVYGNAVISSDSPSSNAASEAKEKASSDSVAEEVFEEDDEEIAEANNNNDDNDKVTDDSRIASAEPTDTVAVAAEEEVFESENPAVAEAEAEDEIEAEEFSEEIADAPLIEKATDSSDAQKRASERAENAVAAIPVEEAPDEVFEEAEEEPLSIEEEIAKENVAAVPFDEENDVAEATDTEEEKVDAISIAPIPELASDDLLDASEAEDDGFESYDAIVLVPSKENPPVSDLPETAVATENASVPENNDAPFAEKTFAGSSLTYKDFMVSGANDLKRNSYYVQIATMRDEANIQAVVNKYGNNYPITIVPASGDSKQILIGSLNMDEYAVVLERFKSYGYKDAFLRKIK